MKLTLSQLAFVAFPGKDPDPACLDTHRAAYRLWKQVWSDTLLELDHNSSVYSDDFTRQELICALFVDERCVALAFLNPFDFSVDTTVRDDSYFKVWPESAIAKLLADGPRVVIGSNITVDPEYRGDLGNGLQLKDLILGLVTRTMIAMERDAMTGTMRCNRGMHVSAYKYGAELLQPGVVHHGVPVDLVAFYRRRILASGILKADLTIESLWKRGKHYGRANPATELTREILRMRKGA